LLALESFILKPLTLIKSYLCHSSLRSHRRPEAILVRDKMLDHFNINHLLPGNSKQFNFDFLTFHPGPVIPPGADDSALYPLFLVYDDLAR